MKLKNFLMYLVFLIPWFLSAVIFKVDTAYYKSLNLPWFAPPPITFGIVWPILYILIAYFLYKTYSTSNAKIKVFWIINYIANQVFTLFFFVLKNNVLSIIDTIIVLISSIYILLSNKDNNKKYIIYLVPYILWNIFALILVVTIFIIN